MFIIGGGGGPGELQSRKRNAYRYRARVSSSTLADSGLAPSLSPNLAIFPQLADLAGTTMRSRLSVFGFKRMEMITVRAAIVKGVVGRGG